MGREDAVRPRLTSHHQHLLALSAHQFVIHICNMVQAVVMSRVELAMPPMTSIAVDVAERLPQISVHVRCQGIQITILLITTGALP